MLPVCDNCGKALRLSQILLCWKQRGKLSYPAPGWSGDRVETPVDWLCRRCMARAERHRTEGAAETAEPAPPA